MVPSELPIALDRACVLSLECWRLSRIADVLSDSQEGLGIRRAVRSIAAALKSIGIEIVDFGGRAYDSGMAPEVIEVREGDSSVEDRVIVDETIAPTVIWHGQVISAGQIIIKRSVNLIL